MFYTYILRCSDDTLYIGYAADVYKRLEVHNAGKASKYTRGRLPVELKYFETFQTKNEAMSRENQLKKLNRFEKLKLISSMEQEGKLSNDR